MEKRFLLIVETMYAHGNFKYIKTQKTKEYV